MCKVAVTPTVDTVNSRIKTSWDLRAYGRKLVCVIALALPNICSLDNNFKGLLCQWAHQRISVLIVSIMDNTS